MDGDFFRRTPRRRAVNALRRKLFKTRRRTLVVIGGTILFLFVFFNNKGILARIRLEQQRKEMIERVKAAEEETKRLQAYQKALEGDRKTIEKVAREKYGMARPGETVYKVKKD